MCEKIELLTKKSFKLRIFLTVFFLVLSGNAFPTEFNSDILSSEDKKNIDLSAFSEPGYIMPGSYDMSIIVNGHSVGENSVEFIEVGNDGKQIEACITTEILRKLGLVESAESKIRWWNLDKCASIKDLEGVNIKGDLAKSTLSINIPQAFVEYSDASWLPPSRWEEGVPGFIFDYNLIGNITKSESNSDYRSLNVNGTTGLNIGAWRLRGDYQGDYRREKNSYEAKDFQWSRVYLYRALKNIKSKLSIGENYLSSDIFDSWRFTGLSLVSDDRQMPPKLRGYAPEVRGNAKTNARVVITQQGRTIYQTNVAAGPFRIQDLSSAVNGQLDVKVEEQDGSVQTFSIDTASIPYLTRPGQIRYKFAVGRTSEGINQEQNVDTEFATSEASMGLTNALSLYGGTILSKNYRAYAFGLGRDLHAFGALSLDVTQSDSRINDENYLGRSWRLSYSKKFDQYDSAISFASYRFSDRNFMTMSDFHDFVIGENNYSHKKQMYTVTASKNFVDERISSYLSWDHQTYWERNQQNNYNISISKYFDLFGVRNISANVSASRSFYNKKRNDALYLTLSIPFDGATISYSSNKTSNGINQTVGYYRRLKNGDYFRVDTGTDSGGGYEHLPSVSGYYSHASDLAKITALGSWVERKHSSLSMNFSGGLTSTIKGTALHPITSPGSTRMLVDTNNVRGIPVKNNGAFVRTNKNGKSVISDISDYYRTSTEIDVAHLPSYAEPQGTPVAESALTEGAIGYRHFSVLEGMKFLANIRMENGGFPPFGARVTDEKGHEIGMVSDEGLAWIVGVKTGQNIYVNWNGKFRCLAKIPNKIASEQILLPCERK